MAIKILTACFYWVVSAAALNQTFILFPPHTFKAARLSKNGLRGRRTHVIMVVQKRTTAADFDNAGKILRKKYI